MITRKDYEQEINALKDFIKKNNDVLGYYVYALIDPRNSRKQIFYIGKGCKNRIIQHVLDSLNNKLVKSGENDSLKAERIKEIHESDLKVEMMIIHYGLTEEHAFLIESAFIDLLRNYKEIDNTSVAEMTNIANGFDHRKGICTIMQLNQSLIKEPLVLQKGEKMLIIKINGSETTDKEIYERVRKSWRLMPEKANKADYIAACRNGVIVGLYKNESGWKIDSDAESKTTRYYFEGTSIVDPEIRERFINKCFETPKGASNPIQYVGNWKDK